MTEAEWLVCNDPQRMLAFIQGKASKRKLRLFGCACVRRVWYHLPHVSRNAVEIAERFADGQASRDDLDTARAHADQAVPRRGIRDPLESAAMAAVHAASSSPVRASEAACEVAMFDGPVVSATFQKAQADLLRHILGNPFHAPHVGDLGSSVSLLAQAIYEQQTFTRLPILADTLEDAGCTDPDILTHCRGSSEHIRGCWVVDLLTGRE